MGDDSAGSRGDGELIRMAQQAQDTSMDVDLKARTSDLGEAFAQLEFTMMFSGSHDAHSAIVAIHAGTGGVDAQDWAEMLSDDPAFFAKAGMENDRYGRTAWK